MPTVTVDDTTLHYERAGEGPAILFVHGSFGDADAWADQAARVADRCTCVRYDRRGHTRSTRGDAPLTPARHADDAAALVEALGLAPCLVVGSSYGAVIAVELARRHGRLLRGLLLSEPPLFGLDPEAGEAIMALVGPRIEEALASGGPPAAAEAFLATVCPGLWATADEERRAGYRANGAIGLEDLQSPPLAITPAGLAAIGLPTLVVAGSESHPSFHRVVRRLVDALPDARFVELEGSGHVTYAERPDEFAEATRAFAAELDRRAAAAAR